MQKSMTTGSDFSYLDLDTFQEKFVAGKDSDQIRFFIGGIRCGKCVRKLEDLPLQIPGLKQFRIDMSKNLGYAEVDRSLLSFSSLAKAISNLGFNPIPLAKDAHSEDVSGREDRHELIRLGVAAAAAGNIMTFSFANYFGDTGEFQALFNWMSFFLYIPVLTYVAWPFYKGAWNSFKQKQLSIDLPMAFASFSGFVFSSIELFRGRDDIYFDSLSGFLFLILAARWAQKRLQRRLLRPEELAETLELEKLRKVHDGGWTWTPLDQIQPGDRILVRAPETLPVEGELISSNAHFGMAWISGEIRSKTFLKAATVPAGARLATGEAQLNVKKLLSETGFGQILEEVQKFSLSKNRIVSLADKWAQYLLATVFAIALIFLVAYWSVSPEEAIRRSLSLIILACPCALAFGTPLAMAAGLKRAQKNSLIVRSANVFERLKDIDTIFFDKTGTLTDTDLSLREPASQTPSVYQKIILALENESMHPIAFAFRKAFNVSGALPPLDGFREVPGTGVSGFIYGKFYELRSNVIDRGHIGCTLFEDHQPIYNYSFEAQLKPDTHQVLTELRRRGYKVMLISGDAEYSVKTLGKKLGFAEEDIFFEVLPQDKARIVASHPRSLMIGDGVNDSLAMMAAQVSVAATGGVEVALRNTDVYLASPSLKGVLVLLDSSRESLGLIRQNLSISAVYNVLGGAAALLGYINPFVAALLMPVSSGVILLSTWIRSRR